jgi:branched-chain amino acid transport system substrate-binding protein
MAGLARLQRSRRQALRFAAAFTLAPLASRPVHAQNDGGEILIGQSCQLTGPLAPLSSEIREGAKWYLDDVNRRGGRSRQADQSDRAR